MILNSAEKDILRASSIIWINNLIINQLARRMLFHKIQKIITRLRKDYLLCRQSFFSDR